jgi:para-aminobenzoate synthetase component 1
LKRNKKKFFAFNRGRFIEKLIFWLHLQDHFSFFNGNRYSFPYGPFPTFAASGAVHIYNRFYSDPFEELICFNQKYKDWLVGRFSYDLKNYIEKLDSRQTDRLKSPDIYFFVPATLIFLHPGYIEIHSLLNPDRIWEEIQSMEKIRGQNFLNEIMCDTPEEEYKARVRQIKNQIMEGDFYELNFCMEYYSDYATIFPPEIYHRLNSISPMPFSVFQRLGHEFILSASPERFLKKTGDELIAQPIKGTIRRDPDPESDEILKNTLKNNEKEIAENMMIVDLMRNDLSKSAIPGSVKTPELFQVYSFPLLHQMISTIICRLKKELDPVQAIRHAFPMGSMTGAPKIRVMKEIEKYESSRRGIYSGAAGYFSPQGHFDFNVLIRSIFYNEKTKRLKFNVGSAITYDADPNYEYLECQLKASAIRKALIPHSTD